MEGAGLSPALQAAALSLRVDAVTAEVVSELQHAAVGPILLKGPSTAAWLYRDGTLRPYRDTDLLVEPRAFPLAAKALRASGFREQPGVSSHTWFRRSDQSFVDLHETLFGIEAPPAEAWALLSQETESMRVGGLDVDVLGRPARLLYVVLHAAQHESDGFEQPLRDLERALAASDETHWETAAALARRLRALQTFEAGLRRHPSGAGVADRLGLAGDRPLMLSLRKAGLPFTVTLERLASTPGLSARVRLLAQRVAPPPDYMRWRYPGLAARSRSGLALAYLWRPLSTTVRLPAAIVSWRRARRSSR